MKEKFKDIVKDFGYLNEQNTTTGDFEVETIIQDKKEKVKINLGHSFNDIRPLDDVTISWGDKTYTVDFEFDETLDKAEITGDEFDIDSYVAYADNDKWRFIVDVQVYPRNDYEGYEYGKEGGTINKDSSAVMWDTLTIDIDDSKADDEGGKPEGFDDIPDDLREHFKKLAGIIK